MVVANTEIVICATCSQSGTFPTTAILWKNTNFSGIPHHIFPGVVYCDK